jgi:hypothetical protein
MGTARIIQGIPRLVSQETYPSENCALSLPERREKYWIGLEARGTVFLDFLGE